MYPKAEGIGEQGCSLYSCVRLWLSYSWVPQPNTQRPAVGWCWGRACTSGGRCGVSGTSGKAMGLVVGSPRPGFPVSLPGHQPSRDGWKRPRVGFGDWDVPQQSQRVSLRFAWRAGL